MAGAYLIGAWIVLQVADTLFPALHLPAWTVTVVAAAAVIGFPIALVLGWVFDITPGGIERTAGNLKFPMRSAAIATIVVALGVSAFVVVRRRAVAAGVDANVVVILPFRVAGDASLAAMREGMVDLLAAQLTGEGGPRALDSRTTLSAWRRKVTDEKEDLPAANAVQLARRLGAGQVLLGEVVGTPGRVAINATLHSTVDGRKITTAQDAAPPDSILPLVDRIVAKLLSQQAGQGARTEALLSESLSGVRAYLAGQQHYRRGDYVTATRQFKAALDQDSTFALAGLGLALSVSWTGYGPEYQRGIDAAWKYRERLPQPDREYLVAWLGEKYPAGTSPVEDIGRWQSLTARASDRVEALYQLGDNYFHGGAAAGIPDHIDKALEAWDRALLLDSTFMPAFAHQFELLAGRGDTAKLRAIATLVYERVQPELKYKSYRAWEAALGLADAAWLAGLRKNFDSLSFNEARWGYQNIVDYGLPQEDAARLIEVGVRKASTPAEKFEASMFGALAFLNMGRPGAGLDALKRLEETDAIAYDAWRIAYALGYSEADDEQAATLARRSVDASDSSLRCFAQGYRVAHGDRAGADATIARLRAAVATDPIKLMPTIGVCAYQLDAAVKVATRSSDASAAVARLDSVLMHSYVQREWREYFALLSTQYHNLLGEHEAALAASKRLGDHAFAYAPLLLERARLAARLGKRAEAIGSYQLYLKVRANPEPGRATEITNQARTELAALVGETRR